MRLLKLFALFCLCLVSALAFAQPAPLPSSLPAIAHAGAAVENLSPMILTAIAGILGFGFRLIKSEIPLGYAWFIAYSLKGLSGILAQAADAAGKYAAFLDKVLPQKLSTPPAAK